MTSEFKIGSWVVKPAQNLIQAIEGSNTPTDLLGEVRELEPKVMLLLVKLAEAEGGLVTRQTLFEHVWDRQEITENALNTCVSSLRTALNDNITPTYIKTRPKLGYQLTAPIEWVSDDEETQLNNEQPSVHNTPTNKRNIFLSIFAALALLSLSILITNFIGKSRTSESIQDYSLAVLPFDVFDDAQNTNHFANGLVEEIIHQLSAVPDFKVISRTSSSRFKDSKVSIKDIAQRLNVKYILEGSVRRSNKRYLVTIQLIDSRTDFHIWSKTIESLPGKLFDLQRKIALQVASSIGNTKTTSQVMALRYHPDVPGAYEHYLKAISLIALSTTKARNQAKTELEQAVALAPDYALAHAILASTYLIIAQHQAMPWEQAKRKALKSIQAALAKDSLLAEAYAAKGLYHTYTQEYAQAEQAYKKVFSINPNSHAASHNYGFMLWKQLRYKEALPHFVKAYELNPLWPITNFSIANTQFNVGLVDESIKYFEHCIKILPNYASCHMGLAWVYRSANLLEKDKALLQKTKDLVEPQNPYYQNALLYSDFFNGDWKKTQSKLQEMHQRNPTQYIYFRSLLQLHWRTGQQQAQNISIAKQIDLNPSFSKLYLLSGLNSYWSGECERSVESYEKAFSLDRHSFGLMDDYTFGISNEANLAYCYQQLNQKKKFQNIMTRFGNRLNEIKMDEIKIPGVLYVKAKYHMLRGDSAKANQILNSSTIQQWPLNWQYNMEPIYLNSEIIDKI